MHERAHDACTCALRYKNMAQEQGSLQSVRPQQQSLSLSAEHRCVITCVQASTAQHSTRSDTRHRVWLPHGWQGALALKTPDPRLACCPGLDAWWQPRHHGTS